MVHTTVGFVIPALYILDGLRARDTVGIAATATHAFLLSMNRYSPGCGMAGHVLTPYKICGAASTDGAAVGPAEVGIPAHMLRGMEPIAHRGGRCCPSWGLQPMAGG